MTRRAFITEHVTDEVRRRNREFGENFDERVHLALGAAGYLASDWKLESEGGFSAVRRRIFNLEIARAHTPWYHWGTTSVVARLVEQFGPPELAEMVLPGCCPGGTPVPGVYRTRRWLGRGDLQDPRGTGFRRLDH